MRKFSVLVVPAILLAAASCSSSTSSAPKPAAAPAPAAAAPTVGAPGAGGAPGGGRGGPPQLTLEQRQARIDSIAAQRTVWTKEVMASIAGKENEPAEKVFKNIQLMKTVTAGQLVTAMDQGIGRGTGKGCNDCHITTDWASDSLARKKTARIMMGVVADINGTLLPKMGPGRGGAPRTIQCLTCHRGGQAGRNAIIP